MTTFLSLSEEKYILEMILKGTDEQKEVHLERLCSLLNKGKFTTNTAALGQAIAGLFLDPNDRLRRWAYNTIALFGPRGGMRFVDALKSAITQCADDPVLLAAGVAALFAISRDDIATFKFLNDKKIPVEGAILVASSRFSNGCATRLSSEKVDIDTADPLTLQNVSILVGVGKVPNGVFSDRHPYKKIIGKLNLHDDGMVQQYSIWAICENSLLTVSDLGVNILDINSFPSNVKKWLYRLIAEDAGAASQHRDILEMGSADQDLQIRRNLASGLERTYFNEAEDLILPWYSYEKDDEVRAALLDHMAANSNLCLSYDRQVQAIYKSSGHASIQRMRLERAAEGKPVYQELRKIAIQEEGGSLFDFNPNKGSNVTVNYTNNFSGGNIGVLAQGSDFSSATVHAIQTVQDKNLKAILSEVLDEVKKCSLSENDRKEILDQISEAAKNPTKSTLEKLVGTLKNITAVGQFAIVVGKITSWIAGNPL